MTSDPGILFIGLAAIVAFAAAFHVSGVVIRVRAIVTVTRGALSALADKTLDDTAKERLLQHNALRLFGHSFRLALTAFCVLAAPVLVVWPGHLLGLASFAAVLDFLLRWEVVARRDRAAIVVWILRR